MITVDTQQGKIVLSGTLPIFLTEYVIISKLILKQIKDEYPEEKANQILEGVSKVIAKEDSLFEGHIQDIADRIMEVLDE